MGLWSRDKKKMEQMKKKKHQNESTQHLKHTLVHYYFDGKHSKTEKEEVTSQNGPNMENSTTSRMWCKTNSSK